MYARVESNGTNANICNGELRIILITLYKVSFVRDNQIKVFFTKFYYDNIKIRNDLQNLSKLSERKCVENDTAKILERLLPEIFLDIKKPQNKH